MRILSAPLLFVLTAVLGLSAAPTAFAGGPGLPPGVTPSAGPVEVFVHLSTDSASPGGILTGDVAIVNSSTEFAVRGTLRAEIAFADGSSQMLNFPHPLILAPEGSMIFQVFLPLSEDVPLGEATLGVTAYVGYRPTGGMMSIHVARDTDSFEIVEP